jgi:hypothetical protein
MPKLGPLFRQPGKRVTEERGIHDSNPPFGCAGTTASCAYPAPFFSDLRYNGASIFFYVCRSTNFIARSARLTVRYWFVRAIGREPGVRSAVQRGFPKSFRSLRRRAHPVLPPRRPAATTAEAPAVARAAEESTGTNSVHHFGHVRCA